jgi:hypothetical protein
MAGGKNTSEFFTLDSFKSLAGSSGAVWVSCAVINSVFGFNPKWLGLGISVIIALTVCITQKKKSIKYYAIALLNGMLIYSTAVGLNTINNADFSSKSTAPDTTKKTSMIRNVVHYSSLIPFDKPWFLPKTLVDENEMLFKEKEKVMLERDALIKSNKKLIEESSRYPEKEKDLSNALDSLNNNYKTLKLKYDEMKKNCGDYQKLKASFDKLQKDYAQLKKECGGYEKLKTSYDILKKDYDAVKKQLQECKGKLNVYERKNKP